MTSLSTSGPFEPNLLILLGESIGTIVIFCFKDSNISPWAIISVVQSYPPCSFTLNKKFLQYPIKPS